MVVEFSVVSGALVTPFEVLVVVWMSGAVLPCTVVFEILPSGKTFVGEKPGTARVFTGFSDIRKQYRLILVCCANSLSDTFRGRPPFFGPRRRHSVASALARNAAADGDLVADSLRLAYEPETTNCTCTFDRWVQHSRNQPGR